MKYLLLVYMNEQAMSPAEREQCYEDSTRLTHDLHTKKQYLDASPLEPVATAKSVRVREGRPLVTSGPFAETHEQLGGFFLVDVASIDEAVAIASRIPAARKGTVEIRPVMELSGLPRR